MMTCSRKSFYFSLLAELMPVIIMPFHLPESMLQIYGCSRKQYLIQNYFRKLNVFFIRLHLKKSLLQLQCTSLSYPTLNLYHDYVA